MCCYQCFDVWLYTVLYKCMYAATRVLILVCWCFTVYSIVQVCWYQCIGTSVLVCFGTSTSVLVCYSVQRGGRDNCDRKHQSDGQVSQCPGRSQGRVTTDRPVDRQGHCVDFTTWHDTMSLGVFSHKQWMWYQYLCIIESVWKCCVPIECNVVIEPSRRMLLHTSD